MSRVGNVILVTKTQTRNAIPEENWVKVPMWMRPQKGEEFASECSGDICSVVCETRKKEDKILNEEAITLLTGL
jgi:hypothetical protein